MIVGWCVIASFIQSLRLTSPFMSEYSIWLFITGNLVSYIPSASLEDSHLCFAFSVSFFISRLMFVFFLSGFTISIFSFFFVLSCVLFLPNQLIAVAGAVFSVRIEHIKTRFIIFFIIFYISKSFSVISFFGNKSTNS